MEHTTASNTAAERLQRARDSLEGLSVGDAFGGFFEGAGHDRLSVFVRERRLIDAQWRWTDDTSMALSIYESLRLYQQIDPEALALSFGLHYDRSRGYGPAMHRLLPRLALGANWRVAAAELFSGQGSFGNGGTMRVAPVGAYFADDLPLAAAQARLSAEITHGHPEGTTGAVAVALAAALAWQARQAGERPTRAEWIGRVLAHLPDSEVKSGVRRAAALTTRTMAHVVGTLGNGSRVTAQDTVPFALWCAGEYLDDYEEAIWQTASGGGDVDTTCAIVGGIVACYTGAPGIPPVWMQHREPLPVWALGEA